MKAGHALFSLPPTEPDLGPDNMAWPPKAWDVLLLPPSVSTDATLDTPLYPGATYHRAQGISLALSMSVARPGPLSSSAGYRHTPYPSNCSAQHRPAAERGREGRRPLTIIHPAQAAEVTHHSMLEKPLMSRLPVRPLTRDLR